MALRALLALLAFCLMVPMASGTTVLKVTTAQMTETSEWVVRGTVAGVEVADGRSEGRAIFTDVDVIVTETYKGVAVPSRITLRLLGGTGADGITMKVPGMPQFVVGEDVVLFLEKTSAGHIPCGLGQGVFRVLETPAGDTWVRQSVGSAHMMERSANGRLVPAHPTFDALARPLDDLLWEVLDVLYPAYTP